MKWLRKHPFWITAIVAIGVFIGLSQAAAYIAGPPHCRDGWQSPSIGRRGACSWHGGVDRSANGLGFFALILSGLAGFATFAKLTEPLPKPPVDPASWRLCPKCRSPMKHHAEHRDLLQCTQHPGCDGWVDHRPVPPAPYHRPEPPPAPHPLQRPVKLNYRPSANANPNVACPTCSSPMVLRTARKGRNRGKKFWGCGRYPGCSGTRPFSARR